MSSFARSERVALADLLAATGPDAPTLCAGWSTADLAAHLVTRERRIDSLPGIRIRALNGWTERVRRGALNRPYPELVEAVRRGPSLPSPFALPRVGDAANLVEFFVHHEDVRRAQVDWEPRPLSPGQQRALWRSLRFAPVLLRNAPSGVRLVAPGHGEVVSHRGEPEVLVTGEPAELVLFCFGRQHHTRVVTDGDHAAVEALTTAPLGV